MIRRNSSEDKYELLAPAGNIDSAYAAINAGADAIYLGNNRFSARAFAENFSEQQIIDVIKIAHLRDVSVYLTLNILINSEEIDDIEGVINPLYQAGLDGVIVQDLGVARIIKKCFPELSLHASTQMSIMSAYGANMLKELGYERVVPARELTLDEIISIKQETGLELECFIHGAMCYSYSGLCLMSSIIGGRSGNRGKCAGTCRLPFKFNTMDDKGHVFTSKEEYPLSMKDMCTIEILPLLMDAHIDSFKIEGRMKSPAYVAGVTRIYRKYMDMYLDGHKEFKVSSEDLHILRNLYMRTEISSGYYEGGKGSRLITLDSPSYSGSDINYISYLNDHYVHVPDPIKIDITVFAYENMPLNISATYDDIYVNYEGPICEVAKNAPVTKEQIEDQVTKLGGTSFVADSIYVETSGNIFVPMGILKSARRECINLLETEILKKYGRKI